MADHPLVFGWIDYSLFTSLLGVSLLIGVYFGFFSKQNTTSEYLFGGKTMSYFPVAMSILASFLSGITFLGLPTEVYQLGTQYSVVVFSALTIGLITAYVTLPVLYDLGVASSFEYLEMRFSRGARTLASSLYTVSLFLYIPIVVYVPALAFSQVTGYNVHVLTPVFSLVCIVYTSMGGVKAVVWTDTIQFVFTIGGLVAVLILGMHSIGGVSEVWEIAEQGGRLKFFDMDPSPLKRDTFWAISVGVTVAMLGRLGLGQKFIQRFLAIEKKADMRKAIHLVSLGWGVLQIGCIFTGLLLYAQYHDCDPLKAKLISRSDQILPHYVMEIAGHIPGLPGIFLAGLVSSGLSTMSASLNTLSASIYDAFVDCWIPESPQKDAQAAKIMKILSVLVGIITIGLVFLIERLGTVLELAYSLSSATEGALFGLLLLGLLCPWVGRRGALTGAYTSLVVMLWYVGTVQWHTLNGRLRGTSLPTSVANCSARLNISFVPEMTTPAVPVATLAPPATEDEVSVIFRVAVVYFTLIGNAVTIVVGCVVSYFLGETNMKDVNPKHVSSTVRRFLPQNEAFNQTSLKEIYKQKSAISGKSEESTIS